MSEMQHFPKFSYVCANFSADLSLDKFSKKFQKAQQDLGLVVLEDCKDYLPMRDGILVHNSYTEKGGRRVVFGTPYARYLYMGKVMIDPVTGSPWAREGAKKVVTDRPIVFSKAVHPNATDHWFDVAKERHCKYWMLVVKKAVGGK